MMTNLIRFWIDTRVASIFDKSTLGLECIPSAASIWVNPVFTCFYNGNNQEMSIPLIFAHFWFSCAFNFHTLLIFGHLIFAHALKKAYFAPPFNLYIPIIKGYSMKKQFHDHHLIFWSLNEERSVEIYKMSFIFSCKSKCTKVFSRCAKLTEWS